MFTVEFDGLDEIQAGLQSAEQLCAQGCKKAVSAAVKEGSNEARSRVLLLKQHTHKLHDGIVGEVDTITSNGAAGEIVSNAFYSIYVEDGTVAHEIRPKAGRGFVGPLRPGQSRRKRGTGDERRALRWESAGGEVHFAAVVHHPGTRSHPFMGPAYLAAERAMFREIETGMDAAQSLFAW